MTVPTTLSTPISRREWLLSDRPQSRMQARLGRAYVTWRQFTANRLAVVGLLIIVALLLIAAFADVIATHNPVVGDLRNARLLPPGSAGYLLGTDDQGRDIFSRLVYGSRLTLLVVVLVAASALAFDARREMSVFLRTRVTGVRPIVVTAYGMTLAGAGAGLMFIGGVAVVLALDASHRSDLPVGVYYAGPGVGIAISGLLVPALLGPLAWDWRWVWVALGVLGLLAPALVEPPLRAAARATRRLVAYAAAARWFVARDYLRMWPGLVAYTLFGLGYIGYMTFVVAFLRAGGVAPAVVQGFWVLLGICAALCGFTWRPLLRRLAPPHALGCILLAMATGAELPVLISQTWSFALSAVLFGSSFLAVVTVITAQVRQTLPAERWTSVMGNATALFALGQLAGPTLTGVIADTPGGLALGLHGSAALLGLAAAIALVKTRSAS